MCDLYCTTFVITRILYGFHAAAGYKFPTVWLLMVEIPRLLSAFIHVYLIITYLLGDQKIYFTNRRRAIDRKADIGAISWGLVYKNK